MSIHGNIYTFDCHYVAAAVVLAYAAKPFVRVRNEIVNIVYELNPVSAVGYLKLPVALVGRQRTVNPPVISINEC